MSIKVHVLGWRDGIGQQVDRIEQGFRELGHEIVTDARSAALVYANDAGVYAEAIATKKINPQAKLILNVLDLAPHLGNQFPLSRVGWSLGHAEAVTTISTAVQRDIRARLEVDATVIYNPIRRVIRTAMPRGSRMGPALFVGRVNDPEKRSMLAASALTIIGWEWDAMVTVGREPPSYGGHYLGEVGDAILQAAYNEATILMCPTRNAFLGLPILEAMACGCIPVVCNDLDVRQEFLPSSVFPEYDAVEPNAPSIARFVMSLMQDNDKRAEMSERVHQHYAREWTHKLSPRGVAEAIVGVYQGVLSDGGDYRYAEAARA